MANREKIAGLTTVITRRRFKECNQIDRAYVIRNAANPYEEGANVFNERTFLQPRRCIRPGAQFMSRQCSVIQLFRVMQPWPCRSFAARPKIAHKWNPKNEPRYTIIHRKSSFQLISKQYPDKQIIYIYCCVNSIFSWMKENFPIKFMYSALHHNSR